MKQPEKISGEGAAGELPLVVAVSSRALFDFEDENKIFAEHGDAEYVKEQRKMLSKAARPGSAFPLVKKLLAFNGKNAKKEMVRIIVLSRNDPVTGLRVFHSAEKYGLKIEQGCFTRGAPSFPYLRPLGAHLFLSALAEDVKRALDNGVPAAHVVGGAAGARADDGILRIAFDGDAVLFSDESERVNQTEGLDAFCENEKEKRRAPLSPGPLEPFFNALARLQNKLGKERGRIRTALVTARGAPAHERPIRTFMEWGVEVDEAFFMNGREKKDIVEEFGADFFFDDNVRYIKGMPQGGHVPSGVMNEDKE